ncbi:MAG TPA: endonuclease/exonuclease/phosphatase family protein [Chthoniobacteraceae bacterium]|jgi:endonuclease/exonuclease/phosphatase family metal-dependent hydrolase|nr:endonuclease/exonuclease/phosphatase family protein [Chthoniobacteraceae bacterium]
MNKGVERRHGRAPQPPLTPNMRLVTWNCFRGECLARAAQVADLAPDLLLLQECARPASNTERVRWFGDNPRHGMAFVASDGFELTPVAPAAGSNDSVVPIRVEHRATGFKLTVFGVWAKPRPTYVEAIRHGLAAHATLLREGPIVIAGDFNSHARFDRPGKPAHGTLEAWLRDEFGLVSAFHARNGAGAEPPTHYWRWQEANGFHLDYCFLPEAWRSNLRGAQVLDEPAGSRGSDHRPLIIDLELPELKVHERATPSPAPTRRFQ